MALNSSSDSPQGQNEEKKSDKKDKKEGKTEKKAKEDETNKKGKSKKDKEKSEKDKKKKKNEAAPEDPFDKIDEDDDQEDEGEDEDEQPKKKPSTRKTAATASKASGKKDAKKKDNKKESRKGKKHGVDDQEDVETDFDKKMNMSLQDIAQIAEGNGKERPGGDEEWDWLFCLVALTFKHILWFKFLSLVQVSRSNTGIWFGSRSNIKIKYQVSWFGAGIWFTEDPCSGLLGWWHTGGGQPSKFGSTHGFLSKYVHAIAKPDNCSTARSRLLLLRLLLLHAVLLWALGRTGGLWVGESFFIYTNTNI